MTDGKRQLLLLTFALVFFVLLACEGPTPDKTNPSEVASFCVLPEERYSWTYDQCESESGSGGVACNADFVFHNEHVDPVYLIVHTAWDNNAMKSDKWASYLVQPGEEWISHVSRSVYKNGDVTYQTVDRLLVVRDLNDCRFLLAEEEGRPIWEANAVMIEELACR
jgi:hypothetical protein